jgi:hypothetical protein
MSRTIELNNLKKFIDQYNLQQILDYCGKNNKTWKRLCDFAFLWEYLLQREYGIIVDDPYHKTIAKKIFFDVYNRYPQGEMVTDLERDEIYQKLNQELILQPIQEHIEKYYPFVIHEDYNYSDPFSYDRYIINKDFSIVLEVTDEKNILVRIMIFYLDPDTEEYSSYDAIYMEVEIDPDRQNPFTVINTLLDYFKDKSIYEISENDIDTILLDFTLELYTLALNDDLLKNYIENYENYITQNPKTQ